VMEHGYTLTALQKYLGLHPSTLSRIVKRIGEEKNARNKVPGISESLMLILHETSLRAAVIKKSLEIW